MLDDLIDSSDLVHPEILRPNSQREYDLTPNLGDDDDLPVGQEEDRKGRGVKSSKTHEEHWDGMMK